jgi:S-formylglutathione hydrolase FrmB
MATVKSACDNHFNQGDPDPFIVVIPNAFNGYDGSWYTNSIATGNWEDYVVQDLIDYIDANYRTLANRENRGISGFSMGGYGALKLAMKHPDKFSAVYGLSSGILVFEDVIMGTKFNDLLQAANATALNVSWQVKVHIAQGAAFSPCSNPHPFYCDFPIDANGSIIDSTWQKWLQHDPSLMIEAYRDNLMQLEIKFDCGTQDNYLIMANRHFHQALDSHTIPHEFMEFTGDHTNKLPERIRYYALPFFSNVLVSTGDDYPEVPHDFSLLQNYPNPFNPVTKIKYSVPELSHVIIVVADVLGNEIETLVNDRKSPGTYELTWHAENLSSGVYFYRFKAGNFIQTKKMLLLR